MSGKNEKTTKKTSVFAMVAIAVISVIMAVTTFAYSRSVRVLSDESVNSLDEFYLHEITDRNVSDIVYEFNERIEKLKNMQVLFTQNDEYYDYEFSERISILKEIDGYKSFGLISSEGEVYADDEDRKFLDQTGFFTENINHIVIKTSYDEKNNNMFFIAVPMNFTLPDEKEISACFASVSVDDIISEFQLQGKENLCYCRLFDKNGSNLLRIKGDYPNGKNLFDVYREKAHFDEGYSLEKLIDDWSEGREGYAVYSTEDAGSSYLYYKPVPGTDLVLTSLMRQSVINVQIASVNSTIYNNSLLQLFIIVASMIVIFISTFIVYKKEKEEEYQKKKQQELIDIEKKAELERQRLLEDSLRQAEQANRAKTVFLSSMSHDIRTPMNAIIGYSSLSLSHMDESEKVIDYLNKIKTAGGHLLDLINDVLDMSRIESGKMSLEARECSLFDIINETENILVTDINQKFIDFSVDTSGVVHQYIFCDKLRMRQVLLNCVGNAVKYTCDGGKIKLYVSEEKSDNPEYGKYVLMVVDNGIGMSKEFTERLFEPFERERTTTVSGVQGSGLGMAITKNIITMMNGNIEVESEEGKGTIVTVSVPLKILDVPELRAVVPEEIPEDTERFVGMRILLVEDNELNREIATELMSDAGLIVDTAENGEEAIERMLLSGPGFYKAVFMDIQMPVMDGYEAVRRIRALDRPGISDVPVIAMTANAFDDDRKAAKEAGMDAYMSKPVDIDRILTVLGRVV